MKKLKKLIAPSLVLLLLSITAIIYALLLNNPVDDTVINLGVLKGPTGIGAAPLLDENNGEYNVTLAAAPTEISPLLISGELDIACISTNLAATLYNKTDGGVKLLALNTSGVLYILENGESVKSIADLKGKTIYATGQAANPEYILRYILSENGLDPDKDVTIEWRESDELSTLMASGQIDLAMLPVPAATAVTLKNGDVRYALDLTREWDALGADSGLYMGCVVVRTEFLEEHPYAVAAFMKKYAESVNIMINAASVSSAAFDPGELLVSTEIVASAAIGNAALPYAGLCYIDEDAQAEVEGYFKVLFDYDPSSIGGAVPGGDFYAGTDFEN